MSYDGSLNEEVGGRGRSREGDPCRRLLLGDAGSDPETSGRSVDEGGLHRRRRRERDVPQPRHARRGDRDRLRPRADLVSRPAGVLLPDPRSDDANRQGNDVGTSYRSAIFYLDEEQRRVADDTIADVEASGLWPGKVVTEVTPAGPFWEAEPEHQDYLERYPNGYTCHFPRPDWVLPRRPNRSRARHASAEPPPLRLPSFGCPLPLRRVGVQAPAATEAIGGSTSGRCRLGPSCGGREATPPFLALLPVRLHPLLALLAT